MGSEVAAGALLVQIGIAIFTAVAVSAATYGITVLATALGLIPGAEDPELDISGLIARAEPLTDMPAILGRRIVPGFIVLNEAWGQDNRVLVVVFTGHPIDGFERIYIEGKPVDLAGPADPGGYLEGAVLTDPWLNEGSSSIRIKLYDGTQTTADADLTAVIPDWDSNAVGAGCAYAIVFFGKINSRKFIKAYSLGLPAVHFLVRGEGAYDPRDAAQDPDDRDSWAFSTNAAVNAAGVLTHEYGGRYDADEIDWAAVAAAADICDEPAEIPGALTEARYRSGMIWKANQRPETVIARALAAMDGARFVRGGLHVILAGAARDPVAQIAGDDRRSGWKVRKTGALADRADGATGKYRPEEWVGLPRETPTWPPGARGEILPLDLSAVSSPYQGQRLIKAAWVRAQYGGEASTAVRIGLLALEAGDVVTIDDEQAPALGGGRRWLIKAAGPQVAPRDGVSIAVQLTEDPAEAYAFDVADYQDVTDPVNRDGTDAPAQPTITVTSTTATAIDAGAGVMIPALLVTITSTPEEGVTHYQVRAKRASESEYRPRARIDADGELSGLVSPVASGAAYDVEVTPFARGTPGEPAYVTGVTAISDDTPPSAPVLAAPVAGGTPGNLLTWSEAFDNAAWTSTATITANDAYAPDGMLTADQLTDADGAAYRLSQQAVAVSAGTTPYSALLSIRKNAAATAFPAMRLSWSGGTAKQATINLNHATGAINVSGTATAPVGAVESDGDFWRAAISAADSGGNTTLTVIVYPAFATTLGTPTTAATGSIDAWGAQLHAGATPGAYVKTTSAPVAAVAGGVALSATAPMDADTRWVRFYRVASGGGFGSATLVATKGVVPGGTATASDSPGAGAWDYFATAVDAAGNASAEDGPEAVSV